MPATFPIPQTNELERAMTAVMIGVDPHKATHTAVVIGPLCQDQVRHQGQPLLVELEG